MDFNQYFLYYYSLDERMADMKKVVNVLDVLILLLALWIFHDLDFSNLTLFDKIYVGTFSIWFLLFIIRFVIIFKKKFGKGSAE